MDKKCLSPHIRQRIDEEFEESRIKNGWILKEKIEMEARG